MEYTPITPLSMPKFSAAEVSPDESYSLKNLETLSDKGSGEHASDNQFDATDSTVKQAEDSFKVQPESSSVAAGGITQLEALTLDSKDLISETIEGSLEKGDLSSHVSNLDKVEKGSTAKSDQDSDADMNKESDAENEQDSETEFEQESETEVEEDVNEADLQGQPATKNEIVECPTVEVVRESLPVDAKLQFLGLVKAIVDKQIVIETNTDGFEKVLSDGTILYLETRNSVGRVYETFGPVKNPLYIVRFNDESEISDLDLKVSSKVYYSPPKADFILTEPLKKMKGTDASNFYDEEIPQEEQEYSDDDQEREAKFQKKKERLRNSGASIDVQQPFAKSKPLRGHYKGFASQQQSHRRNQFALNQQPQHYAASGPPGHLPNASTPGMQHPFQQPFPQPFAPPQHAYYSQPPHHTQFPPQGGTGPYPMNGQYSVPILNFQHMQNAMYHQNSYTSPNFSPAQSNEQFVSLLNALNQRGAGFPPTQG